MRTLRVVITMAAGVPVITATISSCGGQACPTPDATVAQDATADHEDEMQFIDNDGEVDTGIDTGVVPPNQCSGGTLETHLVALPSPGVPADPGTLCSVTPPASSNTSARVTFSSYDPKTETAIGFVAVQPTVLAAIVGLPSITVTSATDPKLAMLQATNLVKIAGGFRFFAKWPALTHSVYGPSMNVKATFTITCGDGGTEVVESITPITYCVDGDGFAFVSAGDACNVCTIIAEMAPSPIVPDANGDGLPLARVIRIVVRELARAGRSVLLMAENDAGDAAEYDWRVSKGEIRKIADDIVLWTLPDGVDTPFGQVAIWNGDGAVVENFVWGGA